MTCQRFKKDMLMDLYGELPAKKRGRLEAHLADCESCRKEFAVTRKVLTSVDSAPAADLAEPDWDRAWNKIEAGLEPARTRPAVRSLFPRWAFAPAALAVLFVLGVVVGRFFLPSRPPVQAGLRTGMLSPAGERTLLARYFENVTPVLLDYANDGKGQTGEDVRLMDRKTAASLLVENMLLRRALARKNPALADLFDDLDVILTEMSNLKDRDASTPASLKDAINNRRVLDRIRQFDKI